MENDFSKPQRQSAAGIIIMAGYSIQQVVRALIIPFIVFAVKAERAHLLYFFAGAGVLVLLTLIYSYFNYLKFTFFLDDKKQEFIINKGVFNKTLLTIPLEKIQQVNINQSLLQKIIGVYSLQIDTAGGADKEVSIKAINEASAYILKEHLLNGKKAEGTPSLDEELPKLNTEIPFLSISPATLLKVGLTSNYGSSVALLIGFAYALFHNTKEILRAFDTDNGQVEAAIEKGFTIASIGFLVIAVIFILLIINIIRTFVKYYDFKISKHKHSLLISTGLLTKKNTLLSPNKVQITTYSQNYFQRKFNMLNLSLKQADSGNPKDPKDLEKSNLSIPGCSPAEKDEILKMILGNIPNHAKTFAPNFRFINLPIIFSAILPVGIYIGLWLNIPEVKPFYPLAIAYFVISIIMIYFSYKRHRLMVNQEFIIKKSGIWDVSFEHIFPHKIQAITTFQYPWHKNVDVGHVNLHTAAGVIHFKYGSYTEIKNLVNYWLYQVESSDEDWM
ncbi:hypothetical protein FA048_11370 [Pedobacter polaris]|uniref:YdbS-like PH domain-containing protein n=1 Tax=Pedobacter polaris TaxID=2571273 RepID=A0A4U1CSN5_9SPHI|nr:PH domain-containing protein [Pedobacter polaris]TKC10763.1 hypothetical protein FA048_11370 [Pedobacter polaris]